MSKGPMELPCPTCGAKPGQVCNRVTRLRRKLPKGTGERMKYPHGSRVDASWKLQRWEAPPRPGLAL